VRDRRAIARIARERRSRPIDTASLGEAATPQLAQQAFGRAFLHEAAKNRTFQAWGCHALLVLKTIDVIGPTASGTRRPPSSLPVSTNRFTTASTRSPPDRRRTDRTSRPRSWLKPSARYSMNCSQRTLLDQIQERQPAAGVALRDREQCRPARSWASGVVWPSAHPGEKGGRAESPTPLASAGGCYFLQGAAAAMLRCSPFS
jgi:hypothetical protein